MDGEKDKEEIKGLNQGYMELIPTRIFSDGKQLSIRLPSRVIEALDITPEKDLFLIVFNKKYKHFSGMLIDKKTYEEGINENKNWKNINLDNIYFR